MRSSLRSAALGVSRSLRRRLAPRGPRLAPGPAEVGPCERIIAAAGGARARPAPARGNLWHLLAGAAMAVERWDLAATLAGRAVACDPAAPARRRRLAAIAARVGPTGPRLVSGAGFLLDRTSCPAAAASLLASPAEHDAGASADRVAALLDAGEIDAALAESTRTTRLGPDAPSAWFRRGEALARSGHRAGGFRTDELAELHDAWGRSVTTAGGRPTPARFHLARSLVQFRRWEEAYATAWPGSPAETHDVAALVAAIDDPPPAPSDWWLVLSWQLQSYGRYRDAARAKARMARVTVDRWAGPARATAAETRAAAAALVHLDRLDDARAGLDRALRRPLFWHERAALEKLRADVDLRAGDPEPLRTWSRRPTGLPADPEARFRELTAGARVLVIGPPRADRPAPDATGHDVVAATKVTPDTEPLLPGRGPVVSYYADTSLAVQRDRPAVGPASRVSVAVARPTAWGAHAEDSHVPVRVMPSEDATAFGASHFGIARIVYDLLRYRPGAVTVAGVDLFTDPVPYDPAYVRDQAEYERRALARVLPRFNHDLADDFRFLRGLRTAGLIDADAATDRVLAASPTAYLATLEARLGPVGD